MIGELEKVEVGEHPECAIEQGDDGPGEPSSEERGRDGKVGDEPEGFRGGAGMEACGERGDFGGGEAIEEEVGGDEVVGREFIAAGGGWRAGWGPVAEVGDLRGEAGLVGSGGLLEGLEHGGAKVYGVDADLRIGAQEGGGEAAIAVAEDEGIAERRVELAEVGQEVGSGLLQEGAEGEVFHPAIGPGEGIEVGWG
jgi:hypothetical protein